MLYIKINEMYKVLYKNQDWRIQNKKEINKCT